ncbi:uncharacterized, partial [Tachysurus ichikawai]
MKIVMSVKPKFREVDVVFQITRNLIKHHAKEHMEFAQVKQKKDDLSKQKTLTDALSLPAPRPAPGKPPQEEESRVQDKGGQGEGAEVSVTRGPG